jgi:hypothetical protein
MQHLEGSGTPVLYNNNLLTASGLLPGDSGIYIYDARFLKVKDAFSFSNYIASVNNQS